MSPLTVAAPDLVTDEAILAFLAPIGADPSAPLRAVVPAPGGYGKSTLLTEVARRYRRAGVPVWHGWSPGPLSRPTAEGEPPDGHALLVDDAHLLDEARLRRLHELVRDRRRPIVLAYRPWPRPAALAELADVVTRDGTALALTPFDADRTAAHLAAVTGDQPHPATVAFIQRQTGGVPRLVDRLARALAALPGGAAPGGPAAEAPESAVTGFGPELDLLDDDVRGVLLAAASGLDLPAELLRQVVAVDPARMAVALAAARATGLLDRDDRMPPLARRAVLTLSPAGDRVRTGQRLAERQFARGGPVLPLVRPLLDTGIGGGCPAPLLVAAAEEALVDEPGLAVALFAAAAAAGEPSPARHAEAAALAGDLGTALRLADGLLGAAEEADRAAGATVAAVALTHQGQHDRAAELHRWSATASSAVFAALGALGAGERTELDRLLERPPADGPPTLSTGAVRQTARGVRETLDAPPTSALATLVRASALLEPAGRGVLLPDSPAALAALVAVHCGELDIGEGVLERARAAGMGARLLTRRHGLLRAWILMLRGQTAAAADRLAALVAAPLPPMPARDQLFAAALELGIARRNSDLPALQRAWDRAREALVHHPVDLFTLLPLGEYAVAAARLGELAQVAPGLRQAHVLLDRLGNPPLWSVPLHWSGLHTAILAEEPAAAAEHVAALTAAAGHNRYATAVAAAGRSWVEVLRGAVDPVRVEAAARALHGLGFGWDGARLAGQAAIRTADRKAMTGLLECARTLQGRTGTPARSTVTGPDGGRDERLAQGVPTRESRLSDREQEVADLILDGLTYRQVGDRLFISAKTVEHHVARMRQRLNCGSRGELLARLRTMAAQRTGGDSVGRHPWPNRPGPVPR